MYQNVHYPVAALGEGLVKPPGLCSIKFFKREDVLTWPEIDPQTGVLLSAIALKPGKFIYLCESIEPSRSFTEVQKDSLAGPFFESTVKGSLRGSAAPHSLTLGTMIHHEWGLILKDKNGITRLIGNEDSGAEISHDYVSGGGNDSRKTEITWKWEHTQPAPIYTASSFDIIIGGVLITAGSLQLLIRFKVGAVGAPMNEGDVLLINPGLINKKVFVLADGTGLPVDDFSGDVDWTGSIQRHIEKALASNTINFVGSVNTDEIIEVYVYT